MKPMMNSLSRFILVPVIMLAAVACHKSDSSKVDDALNSDLSMASQPGQGLDTVSPAERAAQQSHTTTYHSGTTVRRSSSSSGTYSSGATRSTQPIDHVEKHPGRDAAIGAGAGAVIGAATSKDKVKGGLIGAAAGGILGAVIGNNVDKKKVPNN